MNHDIESLKTELYKQFEKAVSKQGDLEYRDSTGAIAVENRKAMAALGTLILEIEKEIDSRAERAPQKIEKGL